MYVSVDYRPAHNETTQELWNDREKGAIDWYGVLCKNILTHYIQCINLIAFSYMDTQLI